MEVAVAATGVEPVVDRPQRADDLLRAVRGTGIRRTHINGELSSHELFGVLRSAACAVFVHVACVREAPMGINCLNASIHPRPDFWRHRLGSLVTVGMVRWQKPFRARFFALHIVGSDDIGRWEGAGTPLVSATVPKISKNLEKKIVKVC